MTYQVIKLLVADEAEGITRTQHHVKLSRPHIARLIKTGEYVDSEYVLVSAVKLSKEDPAGTFTYEETNVTVSDEEGKPYEAFLYFAPRALTVPEALFALGELEEPEIEETVNAVA